MKTLYNHIVLNSIFLYYFLKANNFLKDYYVFSDNYISFRLTDYKLDISNFVFELYNNIFDICLGLKNIEIKNEQYANNYMFQELQKIYFDNIMDWQIILKQNFFIKNKNEIDIFLSYGLIYIENNQFRKENLDNMDYNIGIEIKYPFGKSKFRTLFNQILDYSNTLDFQFIVVENKLNFNQIKKLILNYENILKINSKVIFIFV